MEENNKKGANTLYAVIGVATLVVAIIGATFAYFSAAATAEGDAITGQTENNLANALSLNIERVSFENPDATSDNLVPTDMEATVEGINNAIGKKCVANGYTGCHLYKITATSTQNVANASVRLTELNTDATDKGSWKYAIYTNDGTTNNVTTLVENGSSDFTTFATNYTGEGKTGFDIHNNSALTADTPVYYYLIVYLANKDAVQNPSDNTQADSGTGTYNGTVSMDVLGGKVVASFSASA